MSVNASDPPRPRVPFRFRFGPLNALMPTISAALTLGLLLGLVLVGLTRPAGDAPVNTAAGGAPAQQAAATGSTSVDVELGDLFVKPSTITVAAGKPITVHVTNHGAQQHTLALRGADTPMVDPGKSVTFHWAALTQSTQAWCTVPGHKDAGMLLQVNVAGTTPANGASTGQDTGTAGTGSAQDATIDPNAKPAADFKPFDPTVQPADGRTEHDVTFHVREQVNEVAPGVRQLQWTYNGHAPGPILHGRVGDVFKVTLVNDGTMNHSIDFHASKVAPNVQMRQLKPHESLVYEFKADYAGVFAYHCGADPMIYHMGNGMFGAVIIDPPGLDKVDKEIVLVQSELDLGPQGQTGDLKKMMAGHRDAVAFNGYYNQYAYAPIKVKPGSRIRAWVVNAAINEPLAFHTVGTIFDTVWKEGNYTLRPDYPFHGGSQTLDLEPTQGGFVEFTLNDAGTYTFVNHKMMDLSQGAAGVFQVG